MSLTPDEIAHRSFTPSADGYHQGEVRSFLLRIAAEVRGLQSALPEGGLELAALTLALQDHEPRLTSFEKRLDDVVAELSAATQQLSGVGEGSASSDGEQPATRAQFSADQQALSDQLAAANKLATQQTEAAEHIVQVGQQIDRQLESVQALFNTPHDVATSLSPALAPPPPPPPPPVTSDPAAAKSVRSGPAAAPATSTPAPASKPADSSLIAAANNDRDDQAPLSLFGSDLDDEPLFSDSANDLLDGVIDDVMGNLNDEGTSQ